MIAVLGARCTLKQKTDLVRLLESVGVRVQVSTAGEETLIGIIGDLDRELIEQIERFPGVKQLRREMPPYPLVSRSFHPDATRVKVHGVAIGADELVTIAGPCSVESREQFRTIALAVKQSGARLLRGGAFKPRSSPYSFQGLGREGLEIMAEVRAETGLGIVTEVMAPEDVELVAEYADMLQIGARNMQNFRLLAAAGQQPRPVLLKRGMMATIEELLLAAEYIAAHGNPRIVLCERGIRTFETATRNTLDVAAVPVLAAKTHLPVIVDPSHAAGYREFVPALALASVAAGAQGLIVEVHHDPERAVSDGRQSLDLEQFAALQRRALRLFSALQQPTEPGRESTA